ncbi:MAG: hypothetical protein P1U42_07455, partial [Phycisphaerales bacterium]|nr:hypothetical protein [Phycisphaerales bacterium]
MRSHHNGLNRLQLTAAIAGLTISALPTLGQVLDQAVVLSSGEGPANQRLGEVIASDNGIFVSNVNGRTATVFNAISGDPILDLIPHDGSIIHVSSVAIEGDLIAIGSTYDSENGIQSGAAFVFDANTGFQISKLIALDGEPGDWLGNSISISNGIVAVGSVRDDRSVGSAYVFDAFSGTQLFKLNSHDADVGDDFGSSIDIQGGVIAVGAPGVNNIRGASVYLFDAATGVEFDTVEANDHLDFENEFGKAVAIDNGLLAVGDWEDDVNGVNSGSVYILEVSTGNVLRKLTPDDGESGDAFGRSLAFHEGILVVGAYLDDDNGSNSGSAYIFDAITGQQQSKIHAPEGNINELFGLSIEIEDGLVIVGVARDADFGQDSGSIHLFNATNGEYIQKITQTRGAIGDEFGISIAIDQDLVAVSAVEDQDDGAISGSVYLFNRYQGNQLAKLVPLDGAPNDQFGSSIDMDAGYIAVGAMFDDDNGIASGSAYVFSAIDHTQITKLIADDGALFDGLGNSISVDEGLVAVGAPGDDDRGIESGSAYVFNAHNGEQVVKLLADDGAANDIFGSSIAIDQGIVVVGAAGDSDQGSNAGAAYLFNAITGNQLLKLIADDGSALDRFGATVSIFEGVVAVGAPGDSDLGPNSGSVYIFDVSTGKQLFKLHANDGVAEDLFGSSVAISDLVIAVGANQDDVHGPNSGSAYLFDVNTGLQITKLVPPAGLEGDRFGQSIAVQDDIVAVGAHLSDSLGTDSGSAYVFDYIIANCPADLSRDGYLNFFDVSA